MPETTPPMAHMPRGFKTAAQIEREITTSPIAPINELYTLVDSAGNDIVQGEGEQSFRTLFNFRRESVSGEFIACRMRVMGNTLISDSALFDDRNGFISFVKESGAAGFVPLPESAPLPGKPAPESPPLDSVVETPTDTQAPLRHSDLPRAEQMRNETRDSASALLRATSELLSPQTIQDDPEKYRNARRFLRTLEERYANLGITLERVEELGESGAEQRADRSGIALSRGRNSRRDANMMNNPKDPYDLASTLTITAWHGVHEMMSDQTIPNMAELGRFTMTIAAVRAEVEKIDGEGASALREIAQKLDIEQVLFYVGSWRTKVGDAAYHIRIPLVGRGVPKKE